MIAMQKRFGFQLGKIVLASAEELATQFTKAKSSPFSRVRGSFTPSEIASQTSASAAVRCSLQAPLVPLPTRHQAEIRTLLNRSSLHLMAGVRKIHAQASGSGGKAVDEIGPALRRSAKVILGLNLVGFLITAATSTHKITDLVGTGAFVVATWTGHLAHCRLNRTPVFGWSRSLLLTCCVSLWGIRLAGFLFYRVLQMGHDSRLGAFFAKENEPWLVGDSMYPLKLMFFWSLQSLWAWVVLLPVTVGQTQTLKKSPLGLTAKIGLVTFLIGFLWESVADAQKYAFKELPGNKEKWIDTGLFKYSRHPNYFGEVLVWASMFFVASTPHIRQKAWWVAVSPAFVYLLLVYVSGVPLLEASHEKRYGHIPEYAAYKESTNMLIPWFPSSG
ncbi:hypothetical protein BSKO_01877 [Bryopsis sp. KO-2023]|nr:hypothetical protein BSKO_01877 [Bryopsis sp. KO-2023]